MGVGGRALYQYHVFSYLFMYILNSKKTEFLVYLQNCTHKSSSEHSWNNTGCIDVAFPLQTEICLWKSESLKVPNIELNYLPDKRTDPWLLVYSPVPVALIFLVYLGVVWAGPRLMKHRQPVDLKVVLIVYNFTMIGLSAYMFYEVCECCFLCMKTKSILSSVMMKIRLKIFTFIWHNWI